MVKARVGCKEHLLSSKEGGLDLIFAGVKTSTDTYKAFDITVPDEGKAGKEEIDVICPYCGNNVNIIFHRKSARELRKDSLHGGIGVLAIFFGLSIIMWLLMGLPGLIVCGVVILLVLIPLTVVTFVRVYLNTRKMTEHETRMGPLIITDPNHFLE